MFFCTTKEKNPEYVGLGETPQAALNSPADYACNSYLPAQ